MFGTDNLLTYQIHDAVTAFSTLRSGGVSEGNYRSFNINPFCGDNPDHVSHNRKLMCDFLGITEDRLILPRQIHGDSILQVNHIPLQPHDTDGFDAVITPLRHVCIGVSTADCVPVLLYAQGNTPVIAAVHAGWRGTQQRIVEKTVKVLCNEYHVAANDIFAVIGPCIHREAFEVGDEVFEAFRAAGFDMAGISEKMHERWHIDLPECNRLQLWQNGVPENHIQVSNYCTFSHNDRFFSARRQGILSGRIYTGIILK